jgi:hypothetical protein
VGSSLGYYKGYHKGNVEGYQSKNNNPHITIAVNILDGGKPKDSNDIIEWKKLNNGITVIGKVEEISYN